MNLRACLALLAALLLSACGNSEAQQAGDTGASPALWEVVDSEGKVEGWLFGTVHALPDGIEWRTEMLDRTIGDADLLVVEVAGLADSDDLSRVFTDLAFDTKVPPIASRIDPALRSRFGELVEGSAIGARHLDAMESWAAALTLAQAASVAKSENGVDREVMGRFSQADIVELEGALAQLSIFDRLPEKEQRDLLNTVLAESEASAANMEQLAEVWRSGDLVALEALAMQGMLEDPELYEALLANRNRAWINRLEQLLAAPARPMVAVGAAHMLGKDGLPALLEEAGYTVRRIQ